MLAFLQTQVFAVIGAGGKRFWILRASLCTMNRVTYKFCATNTDPAAQVVLGLVGTRVVFCAAVKNAVYLQGEQFFFSWNFLREGNTSTPSCIFVKLFFEVQQLNDHHLKSWGMTFLTCEPCCALWGLGLYHRGWVFWLWSGIWSGAQL